VASVKYVQSTVVFGGMLSHPNILVSKTNESLEDFLSANATTRERPC
jgi:hypothetical protein